MSVELLEDKYPLHRAAREGRLEDLKKLLESKKYDVNKATFEMVRPLHEACLAGNLECVALLIQHGANVNLANIDGATALCDACCNGNVKCVELLLEHGALVNPPLLFSTPVHEAVFRDNWECLLVLLKHGASMDKSDCHFGTPLHVAACKGHKTSAEVLLRAGANANISKIYQTPLHEAARSQDHQFVELLLEHGACVYTKNSKGYTARQLVPSSTSQCKSLLQEWESIPRSLKHYCRLTIRASLGPQRLRYTSQLRLPKPLVRFLDFQ
ncbi:ankyrin repeat and SOCS box protein 13-like [Physella acuta]|uniref:ankyrin repeat and SOCS box protein 13-like n=1 Tax=Physella acuta TaxID=109671 RepID=UPI0027DB854A|nr:ankyrin repeat and SOCS box protein 13-like [Physella acuta]